MNTEYDPISAWTRAIKTRIGGAVVVLFLFAFVCGLVAPIFGPIIKRQLLKANVMNPDYEDIVAQKMVGIWAILWIIAIVSWILLFLANAYPPTS